MKTISITVTYNVKYFISENICFTECGKYINVKKRIELRQYLRGGKKAIYINGKSFNTENLRPYEKRIICPF